MENNLKKIMDSLYVGINDIGKEICDFDDGYIYDIIDKIAKSNMCSSFLLRDNTDIVENFIKKHLSNLSESNFSLIEMTQSAKYWHYKKDLLKNLDNIIKYYICDKLIKKYEMEYIDYCLLNELFNFIDSDILLVNLECLNSFINEKVSLHLKKQKLIMSDLNNYKYSFLMGSWTVSLHYYFQVNKYTLFNFEQLTVREFIFKIADSIIGTYDYELFQNIKLDEPRVNEQIILEANSTRSNFSLIRAIKNALRSSVTETLLSYMPNFIKFYICQYVEYSHFTEKELPVYELDMIFKEIDFTNDQLKLSEIKEYVIYKVSLNHAIYYK